MPVTEKMGKLMMRVWLLSNIAGAVLIVTCGFFIVGTDFSLGPGIFIFLLALLMPMTVTIPAIIGFAFIAAAIYRRHGLAKARIVSALYVAITVPASFMGSHVIVRVQPVSELALCSIPYAISFVMSIYILRWPPAALPAP